MTPKLDARLLREDIADGIAEAMEWEWIFCECSMCAACGSDEWDVVPLEWQWVRYAPRRWIEPVAA